MTILFGVTPEYLIDWQADNYSANLDSAVELLLAQNILHKNSRIIIISDTQKNGVETPFMNMVHVGESYR